VCTTGGQSTANGVKFAVDQKNKAGGVEGFTIAYTSFDDCRQGAYNADAGVANVRQMLDDSKYLGMVGPYNSAVAKAEIPIAAPKNFVMVSPSNTNPCLTKDIAGCSYHPLDLRAGNPNNYWRVVTTDDYQGPAQADYMYKQLGIKNVGILDDQNICIPRKQMKDIGWTAPFAGGDGIETTDCIEQASGNESEIYATSAGADATQVAGAKATIDAFRAQFTGANDFGGYTMQAYDAANALMTAIGNAIKANNGNMPTRLQVRDQFAKIKGFKGVIGTYDFDQNGDTSLKIVSIYVVKTGLSADDVKNSTGVCGKKTANACFVWKTQFDFATAS
jgi:ABC-type branched-subunit amino acid transport system substrate-binding protein